MELGVLRILLLVVVLVASNSAKKQKKLEVITESKPDDCTVVAEAGDSLTVHYTGSLENGQVFDSSRKPGREPFTIKLGAGQVIRGWEEGLLGMCEGEVRKLKIPSHMGYGDKGIPGAIPGGATLIFSVELLELSKKPYFAIPTDKEFWTYAGLLTIVVLGGYEIYRRAKNKESKKNKDSTTTGTTNKRSKKKK